MEKPKEVLVDSRPRKNKLTKIARNLTQRIFLLFQVLVRLVFKFIYGEQGQRVPPIKNPIILQSATSLAAKIRKQELTSVEVVTAFIDRMSEVNCMLNCVVDERFNEALKEAAEIDESIKSGKLKESDIEKTKPFLGVPITTKDCIAVKGLLHSSGLWIRKDIRATEDADAIRLMREAGAIPIALTNVSEVCMWWESNNPVHGRTNNPYDTNRIVGGSSGGEGCLQAAGGSAFGLGSDIGGSIRMPAFFNGIFGHKPSKFIVSNKGQFPIPFSEEQNSFLGIGPMCRYAQDLKPVLKIIAADKAKLLDLDKPVDLQQVRFHYQLNDGGGHFVSKLDEEQEEAMLRVVNYLENNFKNHPVKCMQFKKIKRSAAMWFANMKDDSGYSFEHQLGNLQYGVNCYWELVKWLFGASKHTLIGLLTGILDKSQCQYGSPKYHHLVKKRNDLRAQMEEILGKDGVFLYPTHPTVAPYHNEPILRPINFSYTGIINVLGFPATAVPLGLGSEGVPLGIQVVANFNQDRLCLAVAEELEKAFGGWVQP